MLEFMALAAACAPAVHHSTLAAVVLQESGGNPYAIGVNRGAPRLAQQPTTRDRAVAEVKRLLAAGHNFDAGLAQINVANWNWLGLTAENVFDPCTNLKAAQAVLLDCYQRAANQRSTAQEALYAALSCYNTGNFERGFHNGYVQKVAGQAGVTVPGLGQAAPPRRRQGLPDAFGKHQAPGAFADATPEAAPLSASPSSNPAQPSATNLSNTANLGGVITQPTPTGAAADTVTPNTP